MESKSLRIVFLFEELTAFKIPLTKTVKNYLNYLESTRNASSNTVITYGRRLLGFVQFCQRHRVNKIEQLKPKNIFAYFNELKRQGNAGSTIYVAFEVIKMLIKYAALEGIQTKGLMQIFCIQAPKVDKKLPRVLTIEQVKRLLDISQAKQRYGLRDKAILELLYGTGIRSSELTDLKLCDVDLSGGLIVVCGKGSKERLLPMTGIVSRTIKKYMKNERWCQVKSDKKDGYLFLSRTGEYLSRGEIWRIVTKYAKRKGLVNVSPHTLRHCFATHLFVNGADLLLIQKALGHSSISTTQIYTHVNIEQLRKTIEKYHPRA